MLKKKKSAKPVVETIAEPVKAEAPKITVDKKQEDEVLHYYRCNVTINNGQKCNCTAFM